MRAHTYKTPSEAYVKLLEGVLLEPEFVCSPRGQKIHEVTDAVIEILYPDSEPLVTRDLERNKVIASYTQKEKNLYYSMSNKVEDFEKISKFWGKLGNPNGTVNSAYGYLIKGLADHGNPEFEGVMRTPWQWCVEALKADKDTRQALMRFSRPEHFYKGVRDFTCTTHGNWLIRDNRLNLSIVMRANDLVKGTAFDWPFFMGLMDDMLLELKDTYPDLQKGTFTHIAHSLHIYESTIETVKKMIGYVE